MFEGLRILELRQALEPAYAGRWFALLGGVVDVVELGDRSVRDCEPFISTVSGPASALAAYVDARKTYQTLEAIAQVNQPYAAIITDLQLDELDRLGHPELLTPATVLCIVAPFGSTSRSAIRRGTTLTTYALSGLMATNGYPGREPLSVWGYQFEHLAGLQAFSALLGALRTPQSDRPRRIEVSGYEVAVSLDCSGIPRWSYARRLRPQPGRNIGNSHPVTPLQCRDGKVFLNCATEDQWIRLTGLIGRPELQEDARFATTALRKEHADLVNEHLEPWFAAQTVRDAIEQCQLWRIPCAPFRDVPAAVRSQHLAARDFFVDVEGHRLPVAVRALPHASAAAAGSHSGRA